MAKPTPAGATPIGRSCYLFKSGTNSMDCMISAHGGYILENRSFTVPKNTTIMFYGEHGAALLDPTISKFAKEASKAKAVDVDTSGQKCRNYLLSKYQGAHAGSDGKSVEESYQQVNAAVSSRDIIRAKKFNQMINGSDRSRASEFNSLMSMWGGSILTIRNRWNILTGIPLKSAIQAAQKEMPSLRVFHCVFCRSNMLGEDKLEAQNVQFDFS